MSVVGDIPGLIDLIDKRLEGLTLAETTNSDSDFSPSQQRYIAAMAKEVASTAAEDATKRTLATMQLQGGGGGRGNGRRGGGRGRGPNQPSNQYNQLPITSRPPKQYVFYCPTCGTNLHHHGPDHDENKHGPKSQLHDSIKATATVDNPQGGSTKLAYRKNLWYNYATHECTVAKP